MPIFELRPDPNRYARFALVVGGGLNFFSDFDGRSLARDWRTPRITTADEDEDKAELADYSLLGTVPVFTIRAFELLADLLGSNGEALPLRFDRSEYVAFNVTKVIDALNEDRSELVRLTSGRILTISKFVFSANFGLTSPVF